MSEPFNAILVSRDENKKQSVQTVEMRDEELMEGDVTIKVEHTTVNYKDGLAITGKAPVVRRWPMIPGIDLAGTVISSQNAEWKTGDKVVLNGWGVGEGHYGAYAGHARLKGEWLIPQPKGITGHEAMAVGTAGYTAMLCIMALEQQGITPSSGAVLVTGAAGGVGSVAIAILAKLGFHVIASTGRASEADFLTGLGAKEIIDRAELSEAGKPLAKERWAAAIDSVGSHTLANVLAMTAYNGTVAACGLAQGMDLPATVAPFILRGVTLRGIDSVMAPRASRIAAWERIAKDLPKDKLKAISTTIGFDDLIEAGHSVIAGKVRGRLVADF
ncbi:MAG: MDR family oxidoreductase [Rhizobiaceae bacterium]